MTLFQRLANVENPASLSNRMRARRFERFERLCDSLPRPLRIIDIGGTNAFWKQRGWVNREDVQITTINISAEPQIFSNVSPHVGDARNLTEYDDGDFDVVFSNSVIEHLFTLEDQHAMAKEVARVGRAYWVQTPNYWFPVEPHFHVPGWQWMPVGMRVALIQRFRCGWRGPCPDADKARQAVEEVRLLTRQELQALFPAAVVWGERVMGLVKSWVAYGGFNGTRAVVAEGSAA
jgi:hypothetical protein